MNGTGTAMNRFLPGNRITLLRDGAQYFPALVRAIDAAEREIWLETYIFADDRDRTAGRRGAFARRGARRARARARRRVGREALSHAGAATRHDAGRHRLHEISPRSRALAVPLAPVAPTAPQAVPGRRPRRVRRRHQHHRRHEHAAPEAAARRFRGHRRRPAAAGDRAHDAAGVGAGASWCRRVRARCRCSRTPARGTRVGTQTAKFVARDNLRHRRDIEHAYLAAIRTAKSDIIIANSYFFPGIRFRRALAAAAQRGVNVTLLLQAQGRVPAAAFRVARAVRPAAAGGRDHPGVSPQHAARQGRGGRRSLGDGRLVQHRSLQPADGARGQRIRARSRVQSPSSRDSLDRDDRERIAPSRRPTTGGCARASTRRRSGSRTASCAWRWAFWAMAATSGSGARRDISVGRRRAH